MSTATMPARKTFSESKLLAMGHTGFFQRTNESVVVSIYSDWAKTDPAAGMSKRFAIEISDFLTHKYVKGYIVELKTTNRTIGTGSYGSLIVGTQSSEGSMEYSTGVVTSNDRVTSIYDSDSNYVKVYLSSISGVGSRSQLECLADSTAFLAKKLMTVQNPLNKLQVEEHAQVVMLLTDIGRSAEFLAANGFGPAAMRH
jgi:hypothetical protein